MSHEELVAKTLPNRRVLSIPKRLNTLWRTVDDRDWHTLETSWRVAERLRTDAFDHGLFLVGKNFGHEWLTGVTFDTRVGGTPPSEDEATLALIRAINSFISKYDDGSIDLDAICGLKPGYDGCSGSAWLVYWLRHRELIPCIGPTHTPELWMQTKGEANAIWDLVQVGRAPVEVHDYQFVRGFLAGLLEVWIAMRCPTSPRRI